MNLTFSVYLCFFFLAISNTIKCGNHSALQIVWVENSTWEMFVTMEIWLLMDQILNSLAVVSFSFPMSLSLSIRPVAIYSFTQGLETTTKRLLKLSVYTLNSVSWKLATWDWMVFYVSNCSYMEFPKMNFLHVKKITVIPIFHSICVSRLKHFPTNGRVSWGVGVVWVRKCEKVSNTSGV